MLVPCTALPGSVLVKIKGYIIIVTMVTYEQYHSCMNIFSTIDNGNQVIYQMADYTALGKVSTDLPV